MLQLNPAIPVLTPKGKGYAHVLIDYSQEHDLLWVVFLDESRECWTFSNRDVRAQENASLGRPVAPGPATPRITRFEEASRGHHAPDPIGHRPD